MTHVSPLRDGELLSMSEDGRILRWDLARGTSSAVEGEERARMEAVLLSRGSLASLPAPLWEEVLGLGVKQVTCWAWDDRTGVLSCATEDRSIHIFKRKN